jgi:hypothetical protein
LFKADFSGKDVLEDIWHLFCNYILVTTMIDIYAVYQAASSGEQMCYLIDAAITIVTFASAYKGEINIPIIPSATIGVICAVVEDMRTSMPVGGHLSPILLGVAGEMAGRSIRSARYQYLGGGYV